MRVRQITEHPGGYELPDEVATQEFGGLLAEELLFPGVVYLYGQLGAGKTTLTRAILRQLGYAGAVKSPTYTLVEEYQLGTKKLLHFDLYRLADPEELEFIGVRDYFESDALFMLEWPQRGVGFIPDPDLEIELQLAGEGRKVFLTPYSAAMSQAVAKLNSTIG